MDRYEGVEKGDRGVDDVGGVVLVEMKWDRRSVGFVGIVFCGD